MEGIETMLPPHKLYRILVSVGAPTWRGLKPLLVVLSVYLFLCVSRCPDMEGIEIIDCVWGQIYELGCQ